MTKSCEQPVAGAEVPVWASRDGELKDNPEPRQNKDKTLRQKV
jgi:hypothetical protein